MGRHDGERAGGESAGCEWEYGIIRGYGGERMALRHDELNRGDFFGACPDTECPIDVSPMRELRDGTVDVTRDRDLVERCQSGDHQAFDELYIRYHRRLHRYCVQRVGEAHDAEDIVQEAFVRAWRALPRFAGERRFYPWLTVIASNLCVDTLRRRSRQTPVEESRIVSFDTGSYDTEDSVLLEDDSKMVAAAFGKLSSRHQRVLQMREGSDWSYRQIAEHEGLGITAVETLLWRARQALKRQFMLLDGQREKVGALAGLLVVLPARLVALPARLVARVPTTLKHVSSGLCRACSGARRVVGSPEWFGSGAFSDGGRGVSGTLSGALGAFGPAFAAATGAVALGVGTVIMLPGTGSPGRAPSRPPATVPAASTPAAPSSLATSFLQRSTGGSSTTGGSGQMGGARPDPNPAPGPAGFGGLGGIAGLGGLGGPSGASGSGIAGGHLGVPAATFGGPTTIGSRPVSTVGGPVGSAFGSAVRHLGSSGSAMTSRGSAIAISGEPGAIAEAAPSFNRAVDRVPTTLGLPLHLGF
ncbi:MAG: RNA polymerase sigma factor [Acidimicrobiales bacterium]